MDRYEYAQSIIEDLNDVTESRKLDFIRRKVRQIEDHRYRNDIETALLNYCETGNLGNISRPKMICMTLHGIRTHGEWQYKLKHLLENKYKNIDVKCLTFGFKDVITFILPLFGKATAIRYIKKQLNDILPQHEHHIKVIVAHSFGTYIIAKIISKNPTFNFDRVIFCGSVVNERFPWEDLNNFPKDGFVNECGTKDIWPILAKAGNIYYGDAGASGFTSHLIKDRFHECGHGGFFTNEFMEKFWLPFIVDSHVISSKWDVNRPPKKLIFSWITLIRGSLFYLLIFIALVITAKYFL